MMQLSAMTSNGVQLQGPALPNLVGSYGGVDLMGFNEFGSPAGAAALVGVGSLLAVGVGIAATWWAFKASRDGSNIKPALIMNLVPMAGAIVIGAAAGAAAS
jgi:hypothetical protein